MKTCKIQITKHAKQRLAERAPDVYSKNYNSFVHSARYKGKSIQEIRRVDPNTARYIERMFRYGNSTKIKLYKDYVFVFSGNHGKAHTLVTVVNLKDRLGGKSIAF